MKEPITLALTAILLSLTAPASSRAQKGQFMAFGGTGLNFTSTINKHQIGAENDGRYKSQDLHLNLKLGYFYKDNAYIGIETSYKNNRGTYSDIDGTLLTAHKNTTLSIGPSAGYYFPLKPALKPFILLGLYYDRETSGQEKTKLSGLAYEAGLGFAYFPYRHISLDAQLCYSFTHLSYHADQDHKTNAFTLYPLAGVSVYF